MSETQDWAVEVGSEELARANPNNMGGEFKRFPFGDFDWEIVDANAETKQGERPHVMLVITFTCIGAIDPAHADEVGGTLIARYAGSPQSPKMMQDSRARLFQALGIGSGKVTRATLIGRKLSGSVIWNLAKPVMDPDTGEKKQTVFANLTCERKLGTARPAAFDVARESAKAAKYIADVYGDDAATDDEPAPWADSGAKSAPATATPTVPTWQPETAATADVYAYRAHVKLGTELAGPAREGLTANGFDPDGPIVVDQLPADIKAQYLAKYPPAGAGGLPGLGGLPPLGANGAAATAPARRTGTRTKSA